MILLKELIGMPVEKALEKLDGKNVKITDFSRPDKYHADIPASMRVVKAAESDECIELFVAGFKDRI